MVHVKGVESIRKYTKNFMVTPETHKLAFQMCPKSEDIGEFIAKVLRHYQNCPRVVFDEVVKQK